MKRLAISLILCLPSGVGWCLTVSQLNTEIRQNIKDNPSDTARQRYTDSVLLAYLNEAQREIVNITWPAQKVTEYILTPYTSYYALPSDFLAASQVYFRTGQTNVIELEEYSQKGLYDSFTNWQYTRGGGSPSFYWVSNSTQASNTAGAYWPLQISYIPIPNTVSTGTVTLWYYAQVSDLMNQGDSPFDNRRELYPYHQALAYYVTMRLKIIEGKPDEATAWQALYAGAVTIMKDKLGRMPNYTPSMQAGKGGR